MSVHRLNTFIKDNFHEIIDYWVEQSKIRFVRVLSRKTGQIYMVKVSDYNIEIHPSEDRNSLMKNQIFYLDKIQDGEEPPSHLLRLYDTFLSAYPEHRSRFVIHQFDFLMENKDVIFQIQNYPSDGFFNFHLFIELEWFYENLYIVNHEIDKNIIKIQGKANQMYDNFIPMYTNMIRQSEKDISIIQSTWSYYREQLLLFNNTQKLLMEISQKEYDYNNELVELNNIRSESLSFQDTVRRSYKRKNIHEKLTKLRSLFINTLDKLMYFQSLKNNLLLHFLYFISDITLLLSKFHSHFLELENLVPFKDKKHML